MKEETIKKGHDLLKAIGQTQEVKESLKNVNEAIIGEANRPNDDKDYMSAGTIRFGDSIEKGYWGKNSIPEGLMELLAEEFTRCLQQCKRHCDEFEHKLKEEMEDLT